MGISTRDGVSGARIDSYTDGRKSYLVKSPCKKLYEFQMTDLTPEQLFTLIEEEKA